MMEEQPLAKSPSPRWTSTTKLLVGLVIVGIVAFLISRFSSLIPPLLMIFLIAYLFHPLTALIANGLHISWKASVNILYAIIFICFIGLLTVGGIGLVQQIQTLIGQVQSLLTDLPGLLERLSGQPIKIGPFVFGTVEIQTITQEILSVIQPLLGRTGTLLGTVASRAAEGIGWTFFVLIVSYFVMSESSGLRRDLIRIDIPGYTEDLRKLGEELGRIWNAFLRGQIFIFLLAFVIYIILLSILGVKYALGIALMAGLAKFLPYIGPFITWVVMALVTFFQASKPFNLEAQPLLYTAIVVGITLFTDQVIDSFIAPRIMAQTLKVHPAAVMVAALVAANLLGILGVVVAAPTLASLMLLGRYTMRKMFDQEPFPITERTSPPRTDNDWMMRLAQWRTLFFKNRGKPFTSDKEKSK
jgi:predicted PurR-regulated permease PerM